MRKMTRPLVPCLTCLTQSPPTVAGLAVTGSRRRRAVPHYQSSHQQQQVCCLASFIPTTRCIKALVRKHYRFMWCTHHPLSLVPASDTSNGTVCPTQAHRCASHDHSRPPPLQSSEPLGPPRMLMSNDAAEQGGSPPHPLPPTPGNSLVHMPHLLTDT
jgi:hypothetical protein